VLNYFGNFSLFGQVVVAGCVCFLFTILGASLIIILKNINKSILNLVNFFAIGIMIAAAIFSLLIPAIKSCENGLIILLGFVFGVLIMFIGNIFFERLHTNNDYNLKRCWELFSSITIHNVPEGLYNLVHNKKNYELYISKTKVK